MAEGSDRKIYNDQRLTLADGRKLAYAHAGNIASSDIVISFHGMLSIGEITASPQGPSVFTVNGAHMLAPTLPGWGETSPPAKSQSYHECLYHDVSSLIDYLHPGWRVANPPLRLFLIGVVWGSVAAQVLYGASCEQFPLGRHIAGLLLISPISPPHVHKEFDKCLSWDNYFSFSSYAHIFPLKYHHRLIGSFVHRTVATPDRALQQVRDAQANNMSSVQREAIQQRSKLQGTSVDELQERVATKMYRSVHTTMEGFNMMPRVIRSDWGGYDPRTADRNRRIPVLIVVVDNDKEHRLMGDWLVKNMENATRRYVDTTTSAFPMEDILQQFWRMSTSVAEKGAM